MYDAIEGVNPLGLEVVTSPTGWRMPDDVLVDAMDFWYYNRFEKAERNLRYLGELVLSKTTLSPAAVVLMYVDRDRSFDRSITDKRKGRPFNNSLMKGTRLSAAGITEVQNLLQN